jgi:hypothetical protein
MLYVMGDLSPWRINAKVQTTWEQSDARELQRVASANLGCAFRQSSHLQLAPRQRRMHASAGAAGCF